MQRDASAPAVGGRPDQQRQQHNHHRQAQHGMRTDHSEIDQDDHHGDGQPIADNSKGPRITGITCEDQAADRTAFKLRPTGKQWPFAAVWTALAQSAPKRRADQFRAGRRHTQKSRDGSTLAAFAAPIASARLPAASKPSNSNQRRAPAVPLTHRRAEDSRLRLVCAA